MVWLIMAHIMLSTRSITRCMVMDTLLQLFSTITCWIIMVITQPHIIRCLIMQRLITQPPIIQYLIT